MRELLIAILFLAVGGPVGWYSVQFLVKGVRR